MLVILKGACVKHQWKNWPSIRTVHSAGYIERVACCGWRRRAKVDKAFDQRLPTVKGRLEVLHTSSETRKVRPLTRVGQNICKQLHFDYAAVLTYLLLQEKEDCHKGDEITNPLSTVEHITRSPFCLIFMPWSCYLG